MLLLIQLSYLGFPFVHFSSFPHYVSLQQQKNLHNAAYILLNKVMHHFLFLASIDVNQFPILKAQKNSFFSVFPNICLIFLRKNFSSLEPLSNTSPPHVNPSESTTTLTFLFFSAVISSVLPNLSLSSSQPNN